MHGPATHFAPKPQRLGRQGTAPATSLLSVTAVAGIPAIVREAFGDAVLRHANHAAMIDLEMIEDLDSFIPHAVMTRFIAEVARRGGDEHVGLLLAPRLDVAAYGCWGEFVLGAPTLGQALDRARRSIGYHSSGDSLALVVETRAALARYRSAARSRDGYPQVATGIAGVILSLFRAYLGPAWRPIRIELDLPRPRRAGAFEDAFGCPVRFDAADVAVAFDPRLADRPALRRPARLLTLADVALARSEPASRATLAGSVTELVRAQVLTGQVSLDRTAEMLDTSARSLQRALAGEGADFRGLVNALRIERAKDLLAGEAASVTEVSAALGYAAPAHFARAFRRETGFVPHAWRAAARGAAPPAMDAV